MGKSYKILIAPLDWGLGHATRCIPLIKNLLSEGCEVLIAGDGPVRILLQEEFPALTFLPLQGYRIKYSKQKKWLPIKIAFQIPGLLLSIFKEQQWLKKIVKAYSIDAIISDNRFGLYHKHIPCIYITHQLLIKTGNKFFEMLLQKMHYLFINQYKLCWVPDFEGSCNIAGELSHPQYLPYNLKYIGGVSRFEKSKEVKVNYDLLILLSGPEPQRTIFENKLLFQLMEFNGTVLLIRGLPETNEILVTKFNKDGKIRVRNHVAAHELNQLIEQSTMIISRSGYTTVMDLIKLQKKAILVPTPGQTEQEYLAKYLMQQQLFYSVEQHKFLLHEVIKKAASFTYLHLPFDMEQYNNSIKSFVLHMEAVKKDKLDLKIR